MNTSLKTLVAAASLAFSASYSHAAVYTMDVTWAVNILGCATQTTNPTHYCAGSGIGTGTWDTATNVLNYTGNETLHIDFNDGNPVSEGVVNRTFTIDTDALTYTYVNNACSDNTGLLCGGLALGSVGSLGNRIGTITPPATATVNRTTGFVWNGTDQIRTTLTAVQNRKFTFNVMAPAIPVPAAAWLFGSGLLGLVGAARKRR